MWFIVYGTTPNNMFPDTTSPTEAPTALVDRKSALHGQPSVGSGVSGTGNDRLKDDTSFTLHPIISWCWK
jgi:hypothetical protein